VIIPTMYSKVPLLKPLEIKRPILYKDNLIKHPNIKSSLKKYQVAIKTSCRWCRGRFN